MSNYFYLTVHSNLSFSVLAAAATLSATATFLLISVILLL